MCLSPPPVANQESPKHLLKNENESPEVGNVVVKFALC